jgi:two-component system, LuxR family, response regulator FixJ
MPGDPIVHVIDDDDAARDALQFLLSAANFSTRTYESANAFLDAASAAEPGCIITDVRMPGISGLELLRRLKSLEIGWPVIVITGQADVPVAVEAIKTGAVDFIEKPYDAEALLGAVRLALGGPADGARKQQRAAIAQRLEMLSPEERRVLEALVDGRSNSAIAHDLGCSVRAIEVHRANVMTKLEARSLSHLVRMMLLVGS